MITAYAGAGGKTTSLKEDAIRYYREGKNVLVLTSTHFEYQKGCITDMNKEHLLEHLRRNRILMCGTRVSDTKLGPISEEVYQLLCPYADEVLIEADGSRRMPMKYAAAHEPVIYENVDRIIVFYGKQAIGHPLCEVCHRYPLVIENLGYREKDIVTEKMIEEIIDKSYRSRFPDLLVRDRNLTMEEIEEVKNEFGKIIMKRG